MGGALVHIAMGLLCLVIVHLLKFRREFGLAIFLGNLAPDALKFGLSALVQSTWTVFAIEKDAFYRSVAAVSDNGNYWVMAGAFLALLCLLLYDHHVVRKKTAREYEELYGFLFLGVLVHLILDALVPETGPWI